MSRHLPERGFLVAFLRLPCCGAWLSVPSLKLTPWWVHRHWTAHLRRVLWLRWTARARSSVRLTPLLAWEALFAVTLERHIEGVISRVESRDR